MSGYHRQTRAYFFSRLHLGPKMGDAVFELPDGRFDNSSTRRQTKTLSSSVTSNDVFWGYQVPSGGQDVFLYMKAFPLVFLHSFVWGMSKIAGFDSNAVSLDVENMQLGPNHEMGKLFSHTRIKLSYRSSWGNDWTRGGSVIFQSRSYFSKLLYCNDIFSWLAVFCWVN